MIEIELTNYDEFEELNLPTGEEILKILKKQYPKIIEDTITEIIELHELIGTKTDNIYDLVTTDQIIEQAEFHISQEINKEILINYYIKDSCGTDRGIYSMITANGYKLIEEN